MMQEKVVILLNERENRKEELATELAEAFALDGITASRSTPSPTIGEEILNNKPLVIITDFILEDFGTGLDLITMCKEASNALYRPEVIFLTDEPSIDVAIAAMKLGASDYILTQSTQAVSDCILQTKMLLAKHYQRSIFRQQSSLNPKMKDLIFESQVMKDSVKALQLTLDGKKQVVVLCGDEGVGKTTLASALIQEQKSHPLHIDFRFVDQPIQTIIARHCDIWKDRLPLSDTGHFLFSNIDIHSAAIIEFIEQEFAWLKKALPKSSPIPIFITTTQPNVAKALKDLVGAEVITIPGLHPDRSDDVAPLFQNFILNMKQRDKEIAAPKITSEIIKWVQAQEWPGHVSQLRQVTTQLLMGKKFFKNESTIERLEQLYRCSDQESKEERLNTIDEISLFESLVKCNGDLRLAAAHLGCSIRELQTLIVERENREGGELA